MAKIDTAVRGSATPGKNRAEEAQGANEHRGQLFMGSPVVRLPGLAETLSEWCDVAASSILKFPRDLTIIRYFTKDTFLFPSITPSIQNKWQNNIKHLNDIRTERPPWHTFWKYPVWLR